MCIAPLCVQHNADTSQQFPGCRRDLPPSLAAVIAICVWSATSSRRLCQRSCATRPRSTAPNILTMFVFVGALVQILPSLIAAHPFLDCFPFNSPVDAITVLIWNSRRHVCALLGSCLEVGLVGTAEIVRAGHKGVSDRHGHVQKKSTNALYRNPSP
jgi:hypothetical protein